MSEPTPRTAAEILTKGSSKGSLRTAAKSSRNHQVLLKELIQEPIHALIHELGEGSLRERPCGPGPLPPGLTRGPGSHTEQLLAGLPANTSWCTSHPAWLQLRSRCSTTPSSALVDLALAQPGYRVASWETHGRGTPLHRPAYPTHKRETHGHGPPLHRPAYPQRRLAPTSHLSSDRCYHCYHPACRGLHVLVEALGKEPLRVLSQRCT